MVRIAPRVAAFLCSISSSLERGSYEVPVARVSGTQHVGLMAEFCTCSILVRIFSQWGSLWFTSKFTFKFFNTGSALWNQIKLLLSQFLGSPTVLQRTACRPAYDFTANAWSAFFSCFVTFPALSILKIPLTTLLFVPKSETSQLLVTSPVQYFPSPSNIGSRRSCSYHTSIPVLIEWSVRPSTRICQYQCSSCAPLG
jgi:hypothetical protein